MARVSTDPANYSLEGGSALNYFTLTSKNSNDNLISPQYFQTFITRQVQPSVLILPPSVNYNSPLSSLSFSNVIYSSQDLDLEEEREDEYHANRSASPESSTSSTSSTSNLPKSAKGRGARPFTASITKTLVNTWKDGDYYPDEEKIHQLQNKTGLERDQIKSWYGNRRHRCKGDEVKKVGKAQTRAGIAIPRTQTRGRK